MKIDNFDTIDAFDLGWSHAYNCEKFHCPFPPGTALYDKYFEGYEQGTEDGFRDDG